MRRFVPALLLLPLLAAGCSTSIETFPCPGHPVATLAFTGTRTSVSCDGGTSPAAGLNSLYPDQVTFDGTIAYSTTGPSAALCVVRPKAEPLIGTQVTADQLDVALDTRGALLSGCNARCAVTVHQQVIGTLQRDPGGSPSGFSGTLTDQATLDATVAGAECIPCTTPCLATYALSAQPSGK